MRARALIYVLAAVAIIFGLSVIVVGLQPAGPLSTPAPSPTGTQQPTGTASPSPTPTATRTVVPSPTRTPTSTGAFASVADLVSIPAGDIYDLWVSPQGELWAAANNGLFRHTAGDAYQRLSDLVFSRILGADDAGRLWALDSGGEAILSYDGSRWKSYGAQQGWSPVRPDSVQRSLAVDGRGQLWLATGADDLRHFDPAAGRWESLDAADLGFDPADPDYQGHYLTAAAVAPGGSVWVGDCIGMGEGFAGQGVRYLDGASWLPLGETGGDCVYDIQRDGRGRMWVGAFDRLLRYDALSGAWTEIPLPPWDRRQVVTSVALDRAGDPWVGILRCGPAACDTLAYEFLRGLSWTPFLDEAADYSRAPALAFSADGSAWICSQGRVYRRSGAGKPALVGSLDAGSCLLAVDAAGTVWAGASYGPDAGLWQVRP